MRVVILYFCLFICSYFHFISYSMLRNFWWLIVVNVNMYVCNTFTNPSHPMFSILSKLLKFINSFMGKEAPNHVGIYGKTVVNHEVKNTLILDDRMTNHSIHYMDIKWRTKCLHWWRTQVYSMVRVAQSYCSEWCFVDHCLSFWPFYYVQLYGLFLFTYSNYSFMLYKFVLITDWVIQVQTSL